jgi:hypothetical protein
MALSKSTVLVLLLVSTFYNLVYGQQQERRRTDHSKALGEPLNLVGPGVRVSGVDVQTEKPTSEVEEQPRPVNVVVNKTRETVERPLRGDANLANVASLLQRQAERLSVLHSLTEQQMRRLEGLEYR